MGDEDKENSNNESSFDSDESESNKYNENNTIGIDLFPLFFFFQKFDKIKIISNN